jgi:hypothetical protein
VLWVVGRKGWDAEVAGDKRGGGWETC